MRFTRLQVALLGVAIGLGVLVASRLMTVWLDDMKMGVFAEPEEN